MTPPLFNTAAAVYKNESEDSMVEGWCRDAILCNADPMTQTTFVECGREVGGRWETGGGESVGAIFCQTHISSNHHLHHYHHVDISADSYDTRWQKRSC